MAEQRDDFVTRAEFSRFAKDVKELIGGLSESIDRLRVETQRVATTQAATGKLATRDLLGIGAFVLTALGVTTTIITIIGAMALGPLKESNAELRSLVQSHQDGHPGRVEVRIDSIDDKSDSHNILHGHSGVTEDVAKLQVMFAEVETQFREERGLRSAKLDSLDEKLQLEISVVQNALDSAEELQLVEQDHVNRRLIEAEDWMRGTSTSNASQLQRIRSLEQWLEIILKRAGIDLPAKQDSN